MAQALALVTTRSEAPIAPRARAPSGAAPRFRAAGASRAAPRPDQIAVIDAIGGLCEVFGEPGAGPGQFDQPSHVIVVSPRFEGEDAQVEGIALVAVADRGNNRVQIFEPEGQLVAIVGAPADSTESSRSGATRAPAGRSSASAAIRGWTRRCVSSGPIRCSSWSAPTAAARPSISPPRCSPRSTPGCRPRRVRCWPPRIITSATRSGAICWLHRSRPSRRLSAPPVSRPATPTRQRGCGA